MPNDYNTPPALVFPATSHNRCSQCADYLSLSEHQHLAAIAEGKLNAEVYQSDLRAHERDKAEAALSEARERIKNLEGALKFYASGRHVYLDSFGTTEDCEVLPTVLNVPKILAEGGSPKAEALKTTLRTGFVARRALAPAAEKEGG
jgi:hypothetical protein